MSWIVVEERDGDRETIFKSESLADAIDFVVDYAVETRAIEDEIDDRNELYNKLFYLSDKREFTDGDFTVYILEV